MANNSIAYSLPTLPYELDALEPVLSAGLMDLHYNKHHSSYVKKANGLIGSLAALPPDADASPLLRSLSFNVSGHALHSLFWQSMTPTSTTASHALKGEIDRCFGSEENLHSRLSSAIGKLSGSGWAALVWEPIAKRLVVVQIHDHQNEYIVGSTPLLVIDGWEHAYYLDYQSDRETWGKKFLEVADWASASKRFETLSPSSTKSTAVAA